MTKIEDHGWHCIECSFDDRAPVRHIVPVNDLKDHDLGILEHSVTKEYMPHCWCDPVKDEEGLIIHNSMDGRESFETDERKLS